MFNTNVLFKNNFENKINEIIENFEILLDNKNKIFSSDSLTQIDSQSYHILTRYLKPISNIDKPIYNLLFNSIIKAEKISAGAGFINLQYILFYLKEYYKKYNYNSINFDNTGIESLLDNEISKYVKIPNMKDIEEVIEVNNSYVEMKEIILEAIQLSGLDGKLRIENGTQEKLYIIESKKGYSFNIITYPFFFLKEKNIEYNNFKILLIDGVIERVSELEKILLETIKTKIPLVIVSQGFSEEILSTIKVNNDRNIFNIFPILIKPDLEGLNIINDICAVCGGDIVSSLKGEQLIFKEYKDLPIVDYIKILENEIILENNKQSPAVFNQLKFLLDKRKELEKSNIVDLTDLIDKRIKSLFSHSVIIKLPIVSKGENEKIKISFDIILREIKSLLSYGYVNKNDILIKIKNDEIAFKAFNNTINSIEKNKISYFTLSTSIKLGNSFLKQFLKSNCLIYIEEKD